jgi:hypothetical protein
MGIAHIEWADRAETGASVSMQPDISPGLEASRRHVST